jgi:hypothetical protein
VVTLSDDADADRGRSLALLEATHRFPVEYHLSVIALHSLEVALAVRAAVEAGPGGPVPDDAYVQIPSKGGKYASHRFRVRCATAEEVLDLYGRVRAVVGVITLM